MQNGTQNKRFLMIDAQLFVGTSIVYLLIEHKRRKTLKILEHPLFALFFKLCTRGNTGLFQVVAIGTVHLSFEHKGYLNCLKVGLFIVINCTLSGRNEQVVVIEKKQHMHTDQFDISPWVIKPIRWVDRSSSFTETF